MNLPVAFWIATGVLIILFSWSLVTAIKSSDYIDWPIATAVVTGFIALGFLTTAIATTSTFYASQASCLDNGKTMAVSTEYKGLLQGCFIQFNGQWIPWGKWLQIKNK